MGTLTVYSVEGHQLHPDGDQFDSRYAAYVGNVRLRVDFDDDSPLLEAYVRVRTEDRKEQVYIRYDGEQPANLFAECRKSVQQELVNGRGWEFSKRSHTDPSKLFTDLVLQPSRPATPSLEGTILADDAALIGEILDSGDHQLTIHARNYTYLGGLVAKYAKPGRSIVVAENPQTQTDSALLLLHSSKFGSVGVPDETKEAIRAIRERRQRVQRREQYEQVQAAFAELAAQDVDPETVVRELQPRIGKHFGELRLETVRNRPRSYPDSEDRRTPSTKNAESGLSTGIVGVLAAPLTAISQLRAGSRSAGGVPRTRLPVKQIGYTVAVGVLLVVVLVLIIHLTGLEPPDIINPFPF